MASAFARSPIQQQRSGNASFSGDTAGVVGAARRRRKETVNERVEHILRGALQEAEEDALQAREGDPETRGRTLQRSHQLCSLYETSTETKFLRTRMRHNAPVLHLAVTAKEGETEAERSSTRNLGHVIDEGNDSEESGDDSSHVATQVLTSPINTSKWHSTGLQTGLGGSSDGEARSPAPLMALPAKLAKPWYNSSPNSSLTQQIPPGITMDAKLRRYGPRGTVQLLHGSRSLEALKPLSPIRPAACADEFVPGLGGSPSLWSAATYYPTGSRLQTTVTRCPSSPVAAPSSIPKPLRTETGPMPAKERCQLHAQTEETRQQQTAEQLKQALQHDKETARKQRTLNQQSNVEWQRRTLHFEPPPELVAHRQQELHDPQRRRRRSQHTAILQTPGYSPEKQHNAESCELKRQRFTLRWRALAELLDAMRRTPCRRPVLQDMEKLFALARELGARNSHGACVLSRAQFTLLLTREFPLCDVKHVNRLFSSFDWQLCDSLDVRVVLGVVRAMRIQQGEPVELVCASLRDFDDSVTTSRLSTADSQGVVSESAHLVKTLSLCCANDEEEQQMASNADAVWTKTLAWQRQILTHRLNGGASSAWKALGGWNSSSRSVFSLAAMPSGSGEDRKETQSRDDEEQGNTNDDDEEEKAESLPELMRLVDEARVPVRRIRAALKREQKTLVLFTQQLLQRRHECLAKEGSSNKHQQDARPPASSLGPDRRSPSSLIAMSKTAGVPISLLHEGEGRTVTIELKNGEVYRGHLTESEDSMNCQLSDVVLTQRDGQKAKLELVYVRGSQIKLIILPDILKNSPLLSKVQAISKKAEDQKKKKSGGARKGGAKRGGRGGRGGGRM
ncbi:hypothetical protein BBJ28_00003077 [Nothophytophthora sp. Chile5]|nr:hypothetical protein BBJ28_00003077 [Nothophytophthora sp. Chile5]